MYPLPSSTPHLLPKRSLIAVDSLLAVVLKSIQSGYKQDLKDFFSYIKFMQEIFSRVQKGMEYENSNATHHNGDDLHSVGWAGQGMMPIAIYLYYMKQCGIKGHVLECGVFKGGSTCCLSHICDYLGLELFAADSFAGLPSSDGFYGKGDFYGSLDEVKANIEKYGRPEVVTWVKGWFSKSLKGIDEKFMMIWIDVDLKQSVIDVLENTYSCLVDDGVIFCDGLGEIRDFSGDQIIAGSSESAGLLEFFDRRGITHNAVYTGFGHMGLIVPEVKKDAQLLYSPKMLARIMLAARPWHEKFHLLLKKIHTIICG